MDHYIVDGFTHCLWWTDAHIEIAYTTPTERSRKQHKNTQNSVQTATTATSSDEYSDPERTLTKALQRDFGWFFLNVEIQRQSYCMWSLMS